MPIKRLIVVLFSCFTFVGCGVDTFQCDDCKDPFTPNNCRDQHVQLHQGVVYEPATGEADFFELADIEPFNELFVKGTQLFPLGNSLLLISSNFDNYVFNTITREVQKLVGSDLPMVGYQGAENLYFSNSWVGDIVINDSTIIKDLIAQSNLMKVPVNDSEFENVNTYQSRFVHSDTLLIPKLFFPMELQGIAGFVALAEDEVYFVSVSSTTNRIRKVFEYKLRTWKQFDDNGEVVRNLTIPTKIVTDQDPFHPTFSANSMMVGYQEDNRVVISNLETTATIIFEDVQSPQLSLNGEYISLVDSNLIDVYSIQSGERTPVSDTNDYGPVNPSIFSNTSNTILFAEKSNISTTLDNAVMKRATFDTNEPLIEGTVFELNDHIEVDSLDFLISRASKPVYLNDQEIFFLLFQHQLTSCDRFF